ncbi:hypothetical protein QN277_019005 [Acacia crassicarpa]|uniref:RNase III domain-containing protein n=1 Tax=Acacia crassicarpa TaxID=499986 RepID=A0AAE1JX29_9FABA|nr:hypothetical protein QN277_019005 [Acacia crassicarpa]
MMIMIMIIYEAETKYFSFKRLEFLGDAVLNFLVTKEQFFSYPDFSSGELTRLRAANVDTEKLARVAVKHELCCYLRHKSPLLEEQIDEFMKEILEYPIHSNGLIDVPKGQAKLVESIIGAIFIDSHSNINIVWQVFRPLLEPMINAETLKTHPVTELHQVLQKHNLEPQFVDSWKDSMAVEVLVDDQLVGKGICGSKKEIAKNRAALNALQNIQTILSTKDNSTSNDNTKD